MMPDKKKSEAYDDKDKKDIMSLFSHKKFVYSELMQLSYETNWPLDTLNQIYYQLKCYDLFQTGIMKQALEEYDKAIALYPEDPYFHVEKGDCLVHYDKMNEALEEYDKAIALYPHKTDFYCFKGYCLVKLGMWEEAMKIYHKIIDLDPSLKLETS